MTGWQDCPEVVMPQQNPSYGANHSQPRTGSSLGDAITAGWQGSATGLAVRGKLPDVVLDGNHAPWYQKLAASATQMVSELPEMIAGSAAGGALAGAAGLETGPGAVITAAAGAGAGAFAVPTAIREGLTQAYLSGQADSSSDWLSRAGIVLKATGKDALVGALTGGTGAFAGRALRGLAMGGAEMAGPMTAGATRAVQVGSMAAEGTTMTVAPALLAGRLPEKEDFYNTAAMMVGMHLAGAAANRLMNVYAKTGKTPMEVMGDAAKDATILEDLKAPIREAAKSDLYVIRDENGNVAKGIDIPADTPPGKRDAMLTEAGIDPAKAELIESVPDPNADLPDAYKPLAAATAAEDAVPGTPAAPGSYAEPFGPSPRVPGEPEPTTINPRFINSPETLLNSLARLMRVNLAALQDQNRGTVSHGETEMAAWQRLTQLIGGDGGLVPRITGTAENAAGLVARKQLMEILANDMAAKAKAIADAGGSANVSPQQMQEYLASVDRTTAATQYFLGARAETARAFNALQITSDTAGRAEDILSMLKDQGKDPGKVAEMMAGLDSAEGAVRMAKAMREATTWDKIVEAWKAGLLGPITLVKKSISDIAMMASRPIVDTVSYGFNRLSGAPERMSAVEPLARVIGNVMGTKDGLIQAWEELKTEHFGGVAENRGAIPGVAGEVIRTPFRLIEAVTALFRNMERQGELYAEGARTAAGEGLNPLTSEFQQRVAEYAANPPEKSADAVDALAKRYTFGADMGQLGKTVTKAVDIAHAQWLFPFIKTPINVFKETLRFSPFAPFVPDWRVDWNEGGIAKNRAAAEMTVGIGLASLGMALASAGHISGAGDPDPNKNRVAQAAGWQPYSLNAGGKWYSINMIHPVGILMGMCADVHEASAYMDADQLDKAGRVLGKAFAHAITEQTFLQGMTTLVKTINEPERQMPFFMQQMGASVVPAWIGQPAQMLDPYKRQVDSILQAVQSRIPGARENLQQQLDPWGEPIKAEDRFGGITPIKERTPSDDLVRTEAARLGVGEGRAPKFIHMPAAGVTDLGKIPLSEQQQFAYGQAAGQFSHQIMDQIVHGEAWQTVPDDAKRQIFKEVLRHGHEMGNLAAVPPEQRMAHAQQIADELSKRAAQ